MKEKYRTLIKNILIFTVGGVGSRVILFLMVPLYTNFLTKAEYGISDLVFTVSQMLIPIFSLVIFDAVVRFGLSKEEKPENVLLIGLGVVLLGGVLTVLLTPLLDYYEPLAQWKWYVSVYIVLNMIASVETNYLRATDRTRLYTTISLLQTLLLASLNVLLLVVFRLGIRGYLLASIAATGFSAAAAFLLGRLWRDLGRARVDRRLTGKMLAFSAPLILNNLSWWALQSSNKLLIERSLGSGELGLYTVATKIPALINVVITIFSQAWNISAVKELEGDDDGSFYANVLRYYQLAVFGFAVVLIGVMKPFMRLYVSEAYFAAWQYTPLLLTGAVFHAITAYYASLYGALKKSVNNMLQTLSAAVVHVAVAALLVGRVGLWGAAIATVAAYLVLMIARIAALRRFCSVKTNYGRLLVNSILLLTQAVLVSLDFHVYPVSAAALILFLLCNRTAVSDLMRRLRRKEMP